jgi:hypothetical protein
LTASARSQRRTVEADTEPTTPRNVSSRAISTASQRASPAPPQSNSAGSRVPDASPLSAALDSAGSAAASSAGRTGAAGSARVGSSHASTTASARARGGKLSPPTRAVPFVKSGQALLEEPLAPLRDRRHVQFQPIGDRDVLLSVGG